MTVANYGPRINVHPDRTGATKSGRNRLLVVHTSEGGEGPTSAENLGAFMTMPGDRIDPSDGSRFGASYQYVTDTDRVLPATPDNMVAYAAAGANNDGIHICIPGRAGQTREQWLDATSRSYIRRCAEVLVDKAAEHKIPLQRISPTAIVGGASGYCGHVDVSQAYHRSDHTDPGAQFPWDVLAADIAELAREDDDMTPLDVPERVYDSRTTGGEFAAGEVRTIPVGMCTKAFLHITAVGTDPGYVSISGTDTPSPASIANVDADGVASGGAPIGVPDGKVRVRTSGRCHVVVDVFARGV